MKVHVRAMLRRVRAMARPLLRRAPIVHRAPARATGVALTFDDGPSEWTLEIAHVLEAHGCRGTFFVLGSAVERNPQIVKTLTEAGHEIGNHLWSHSDPEQQTRKDLRAELERTAQAIERAGGGRPRLIRPPYCGAPEAVAAAAFGTRPSALVVLRSVDPADWRAEAAAEVIDRVLDRITPGDIVCLHDGISPGNNGTLSRAVTASAVAKLVPELLNRGLKPVTVSELLA